MNEELKLVHEPAVAGIIIGSDVHITGMNPCGEIMASPYQKLVGNHNSEALYYSSSIREEMEKNCETVTCFICGCPDLIENNEVLWTCMSCGCQHHTAIITPWSVAQSWQPTSNGVLDLVLNDL